MEPSQSFFDAQSLLADKARSGTIIAVDLDPDGTWSPWAAIVILQSSGVAYIHQCGGVACHVRLVEGYLVPLGGLLLDPGTGLLDPLALTVPFHDGKRCNYMGIESTGLERLADLVARIAFWSNGPDETVSRTGLVLDRSRVSEVTEGWVPVLTSAGPGILLWKNCD